MATPNSHALVTSVGPGHSRSSRLLQVSGDIAREAIIGLLRNRVRAGLSMLGISWGIVSVVMLLVYGEGFNQALIRGFHGAFGDVGGHSVEQQRRRHHHGEGQHDADEDVHDGERVAHGGFDGRVVEIGRHPGERTEPVAGRVACGAGTEAESLVIPNDSTTWKRADSICTQSSAAPHWTPE